jgi:hypothetical protein
VAAVVAVADGLVGITTMIAGADVGMAVPVHAVKCFLKERLGRQADCRLAVDRAE